MVVEGLWKTLEEILRRYGAEERLREQLVVVEWDEEAPEGARAARPLYVDKGVLYLGVRNHALAQELELRRDSLLRELREKGYELHDIRFRILPPEPPPVPPHLEVEVTPDDERWAREELAGEELPPGLRERMVGVLAAIRARERAMLAAGARRCRLCGVAFFGEEDTCPLCRAEGRA